MVAAALLAASCGSEAGPTVPDISLNPTTTVADDSGNAIETTTTTEMPGVELELTVAEGTELQPFGLEVGELIEFRELPDVSFDVVETVEMGAAEPPPIVATGVARTITGGVWWEVTVNGTTAWVERSNVAVFGEPTEILEEVLAVLDVPPRDLDALGRLIGRTRFGEARARVTLPSEPEGLSQVAGTVVVDLIGLRDEGVRGERLVIQADIFRNNGGATVSTTNVNSIQRFPVCETDAVDGVCLTDQ